MDHRPGVVRVPGILQDVVFEGIRVAEGEEQRVACPAASIASKQSGGCGLSVICSYAF
jgi:hypothetical protein